MDLSRYDYHIGLLEYRDGTSVDRLSTLRLDIHRPMQEFCAFAGLLDSYINETNTDFVSVRDFQSSVKAICATIKNLIEKTPFNCRSLTDEEAKNILLQYWNRYDIVESALTIPDQMRAIENELRTVLPDFEISLESLANQALLLQAQFDVLANTGELTVPNQVIEVEKALRALKEKSTSRTNEALLELIEASKHEMAQFRYIAATSLGIYPDERSVDALIYLLNDEFESIRRDAAMSLRRIKNKKAVPSLIQALQQDFRDEGYRGAIVYALIEMPDERALDTLIAVLDYLISQPYSEQTLMPIRIARVRKAISAIGSPKADEALKKHFGPATFE